MLSAVKSSYETSDNKFGLRACKLISRGDNFVDFGYGLMVYF